MKNQDYWRKKEAQKKEDKRLKEEERDTFWGLFDLKMEQDRNLDLTYNERMELEQVSVMGDISQKWNIWKVENNRCSKWIDCRLIRAVILKNWDTNSNGCVTMKTNENDSTQVQNIANS